MQKFIKHNEVKILLLLISVLALNFLEKFPYFNTFLAYPYPWNSFLLLFLLTVVLFKLDEVFSFGLAFVFFWIACFFGIFGKVSISEKIGTIVYALIWFAFVQMSIKAWRKECSQNVHEKK